MNTRRVPSSGFHDAYYIVSHSSEVLGAMNLPLSASGVRPLPGTAPHRPPFDSHDTATGANNQSRLREPIFVVRTNLFGAKQAPFAKVRIVSRRSFGRRRSWMSNHDDGSESTNGTFGAQSHDISTRCLRFTARLTPHHARLASGRLPGSTGRDWLPVD